MIVPVRQWAALGAASLAVALLARLLAGSSLPGLAWAVQAGGWVAFGAALSRALPRVAVVAAAAAAVAATAASAAASAAAAAVPHVPGSAAGRDARLRDVVPDAAATSFGELVYTLRYSLAQVTHAVWNKYRLPLPDERYPALLGVDTTLEEPLGDGSVRRVRRFRMKNTMPRALQWAVGRGPVEADEESVQDASRLVLATVNRSFDSLCRGWELCTYRQHPQNPDWTVLEVSAAGLPSDSLRPLAGTLLGFLKAEFEEGGPRKYEMMRERLGELFPPDS